MNNHVNNWFAPHGTVEERKFKNLPLSAKYLYCILAKLKNRYEDKDGWFYRGMVDLCDDVGCSMTTLKQAKKALKENEYIDVKLGFFEHSQKRSYDYYRLNGFRFRGSKKGL